MLTGYRFRLYPTKAQQQILLRWIGCQRLIYNAKVQEDRYYRAFQRRFVGTAGMTIPVDQEYARFISEETAFLREVPSQVLRNGTVRFRQAYQRFFQKRGGRPKLKKKSGRQAVWLTSELFQFIPLTDKATGEVNGYQLHVGTTKFPVGMIPYVAHRPHAVPASIYIAVEGGQWWLSFAADDSTVAIPGNGADVATERIADDLRHLSAEQLTERTLGGDRGVAKPLMTSDGHIFDLQPVQKARIAKHRRQRQKWQRRAARRKKGSKNQQKAYRKVARYQRYEKNVRQDYAHQTSHRLVVNNAYDLYVFEDLKIAHMTKRPKAKKDVQGRFLPNGRQAKAALHRAILSSAWGEVVAFTRYKALRRGKLVITVPPQSSSQECAVCTFTSPDNRRSQAEFVCQRCGHRDNADHNAACVIAKRGIHTLLSGIPLTKEHKRMRIFRKLGPERSEVTPGEIRVRRLPPMAEPQGSQNQEPPGAIPETPASAS
ncbi:Transposase [Sulfobacillus thermosulfidooxidans DSM 9293]|uniref:Transposase n=1 Tax=Sulfobacillus thermosulfidooxidans (strain DSM 9293 / VKM B-1269 / AT-1) TaxID=929705 RepID=A0A1W1W700_SULTA|nr:RNA-guided endonuclease TnpB family protein [Sulfobacillus thermosulfidooxidans]SMC02056.1 Transposase [Sulfobacillus thermosulfidooxidans DSM 9293]